MNKYWKFDGEVIILEQVEAAGVGWYKFSETEEFAKLLWFMNYSFSLARYDLR